MPAFSTYIGHMTTEHTHSTEQRLLSVIICKKNNYHDDDDDKWKNKISERTKKFQNFWISLIILKIAFVSHELFKENLIFSFCEMLAVKK
jgi:predicted metal-dependent hydrolase